MNGNLITRCRICGSNQLELVLDLGLQSLTGHFPKSIDEPIDVVPLQLVKCIEDQLGSSCGLLQLRHSSDPHKMYGANYGYRSGLNNSMICHLNLIVTRLLEKIDLKKGDLILDIGSSDATLLKAYPLKNLTLVGIDPAAQAYRSYYPEQIKLIPEFFTLDQFNRHYPGRKVKLITTIAMFYDLERPLQFMKEIYEVLDDEGLWLFEQSYMPTMIKMNAYDTVCHEHLEYYDIRQIKWLTDRANLKIVDIEFNEINGGSFAITVAKSNSSYVENKALVNDVVSTEINNGFSTLTPYLEFSERVKDHRRAFRKAINKLNLDRGVLCGYGASTKGNVLLQYCDLTAKDIPFIADVNETKFGCFTPGSNIPIISEDDARTKDPRTFIVFPWHFKEEIIRKERLFLNAGGRLLFPLPSVSLI